MIASEFELARADSVSDTHSFQTASLGFLSSFSNASESGLLPWLKAETKILLSLGRYLLSTSQVLSPALFPVWMSYTQTATQCLWEIEVRRDCCPLPLLFPSAVISPAGYRNFSAEFNEESASFLRTHHGFLLPRVSVVTLPWHRLRTSTRESWHYRCHPPFWQPLFRLRGSNHSQLLLMKLYRGVLLKLWNTLRGKKISKKKRKIPPECVPCSEEMWHSIGHTTFLFWWHWMIHIGILSLFNLTTSPASCPLGLTLIGSFQEPYLLSSWWQYYFTSLNMFTHGRGALLLWRTEDSLGELPLSFHRVSSNTQTRVIGIASQLLYSQAVFPAFLLICHIMSGIP